MADISVQQASGEGLLRFDYAECGVSTVEFPYTTGWRVLPTAMFNQWQNVQVLVEIENGPRVIAQSNRGILIEPGIRHRLTVRTRGKATCRWSHLQFTVLEYLDAFSMLDMPLLTDPASADAMGEVSEALSSFPSNKKDLSLGLMARRMELAFKLFGMIHSVSVPDPDGVKMISEALRIEPCLSHIRRQLAGPLTRESLAAQMGLSPTRFHVVFSRATGMAPMQYVRQIRIRHAQRLLLETTLSVAEIGARIGFEDPFHFSRMFKTAVGQSPAVYRRKTERFL